MQRTVEYTSTWAVLYFIAWTVLGAFVLLELFLAIILGAFETILQQEREEKEKVT